MLLLVYGLLLVIAILLIMLLHNNNSYIDFKKDNNLHVEVESTKRSIVMIMINDNNEDVSDCTVSVTAIIFDIAYEVVQLLLSLLFLLP